MMHIRDYLKKKSSRFEKKAQYLFYVFACFPEGEKKKRVSDRGKSVV